MKIKIGKLMILWGDPVDLLQEEFKARARVIEAKRLLQLWVEEDSEPYYIKKVKSFIRQGHMLLAVKTYLKEHPDDGLRDARISVENIKSKMEINAKNK